MKVLLPSLLAVSSIAILLYYIVNGIFEDTNRLDSAYSEKLAVSAMASLQENLATIVYDNSVWDDAAYHVSTMTDLAWFDGTWGDATGLDVYDAVFVVDPDGKTLYAARNGKRSDLSAEAYLGPDIESILEQARAGKPGDTFSGILPTGSSLSTIAAARIVPQSQDISSASTNQRQLVLARTIDDEVLASIAHNYAMEDLRLVDGTAPVSDTAMPILSPSGKTIGTLAWKSRHPGDLVRDRYGRVVAMVLVMFLFVIAVLLYMSWKGFKEAHDSQADAIAASLRDDLTGLANRRQTLAALTRCLAEAKSGDGLLSVIYADLDGFKEVNDSYGHEIGDMLLKAAAAGFAYLGREASVISRLGGDEFAMIMTGPGSSEKARAVAQSMISFFEQPMNFDGRIASVSVSVGIVDFKAEEVDVEEIIRRADVAMYKAKSEGRNRVFVYQKSLDFKRDENRSIALRLREHIDQGNLSVVYQPIVDARSRRVRGVEALVRWPNNAPTSYTPDQFIPVAEEFGLIEDLGQFVLSEACRQAAKWPEIFVAVNVSPIQFMNPNFAELVERTLAKSGLDAKRLEIEVTEGFIIDNEARANAIITHLHQMHVRVALDDFGTGFSSIGHLRRFKFDKLKLDRSMVEDILRQPAALRLVQGTIAMADALGLTVLAEGIEDENQVSVLRLAGCSQFQGFLFSRPVEARHISAFIEDQREALAG